LKLSSFLFWFIACLLEGFMNLSWGFLYTITVLKCFYVFPVLGWRKAMHNQNPIVWHCHILLVLLLYNVQSEGARIKRHLEPALEFTSHTIVQIRYQNVFFLCLYSSQCVHVECKEFQNWSASCKKDLFMLVIAF